MDWLMNPKDVLLIFDCDGVLVDSEPLANKTFIHCLRQEGFDVDEAYGYAHFLGISTRDCIAHIESKFQRKVSGTFLDTLSLLTNQEIINTLQPIPNIKEALAALPHPKCVASGSEPEKIRLSLEVTGLAMHFKQVYSSLQVERGKPFPDIFLYAAKEMGYTPGQCIVIEDSIPGMQAALRAGMNLVWYRPVMDDDTPFPGDVTVIRDMALLPDAINKIMA